MLYSPGHQEVCLKDTDWVQELVSKSLSSTLCTVVPLASQGKVLTSPDQVITT